MGSRDSGALQRRSGPRAGPARGRRARTEDARPADLVFVPTFACGGVRSRRMSEWPLLTFSRPGGHLDHRRGRTYS
jgi:hypothetical protein